MRLMNHSSLITKIMTFINVLDISTSICKCRKKYIHLKMIKLIQEVFNRKKYQVLNMNKLN